MSERHLSALDLDLLLVAGPTSTETVPLQEHLQACPACRDRQQARAARHEEFELQQLARLQHRARGSRQRRTHRAAWWGLGLLPVAALALLLAPWPRTPPPSSTPVLGIKGDPGLRLVARRGEAVFDVAPGATLLAGDGLRFVLEPVGRPYLLIGSIDGGGKASIYHPFGGSASAAADPARTVEAPDGSVILDRTPGPERVFVLWSAAPLQAAAILDQLAALGRQGAEAIRATTTLDVPGTIQTSALFEKGAPP